MIEDKGRSGGDSVEVITGLCPWEDNEEEEGRVPF